MLLVSDIHGAFEDLRRVGQTGEPLLVLGDLINLTDYRNGEGITSDLLGPDFARRSSAARAAGDYVAMRRLFTEAIGDNVDEFRAAYAEKVEAQYVEARRALEGTNAIVTYGNVDRPSVLRRHLPPGVRFVDGEVVEVEGIRVGFVGGGITTPLGAEGEVSDAEMAAKLATLGPVDVLCSHLPPAVAPLHTDVVTGRQERASQPILDYLLTHQPGYHFFGDVHQPQAIQWRVGPTLCRNVGYFRATKRAVHFDPYIGR